MTTATELLDNWRSRGIHARRDGDDLVVRGDMTDEEIALARTLKPALLDLLSPAHPVTEAATHGAIPIPTAEILRAAWRGAVLELGEIGGHPSLVFKPGHRLSPGRAGYMKFASRAVVPDLVLAATALRTYVNALPMPPEAPLATTSNSPMLENKRIANRCADCSEP